VYSISAIGYSSILESGIGHRKIHVSLLLFFIFKYIYANGTGLMRQRMAEHVGLQMLVCVTQGVNRSYKDS